MRLIKRNFKNIKIFAISFLLLFSQLALPIVALQSPVLAIVDLLDYSDGGKVTICHATSAQVNPYRQIAPDVSGVIDGHNGHEGLVFDGATKGWGDIIPPFYYDGGQYYDGKNWSAEGQAIWNSDCGTPEDDDLPTLSLIKKVEASDIPATNWTLTATPAPEKEGLVEVSGPGGFESTVIEPQHRYILSEVGPTGYDAGEWKCEKYEGGGKFELKTKNNKTKIKIWPNTDVTCTITNTGMGKIIVEKDAQTDSTQEFVFHNNFRNDNPDRFVLVDDSTAGFPSYEAEVVAGTYSVAEEPVLGWKSPETTTCSNDDESDAVTVLPGETVTCKFVNKKLAQITLVKETVGGDGTFGFTMTGDGLPGTDTLTTVAGTDSEIYESLDPDNTYAISEKAMNGWDLESATCDNKDLVTAITPNVGEKITCTFKNVKRGTITIEKQTVPDGSEQGFEFIGDPSGTIKDGEKIEKINLEPGQYTSTENKLAGWELTSIDCDDKNSSGEIESRKVFFNVDPGEDVTCTFVNERQPVTVVAYKIVCTDESELPDWGAVQQDGNPIEGDTATKWVAEHGSCDFGEGWEFQWSFAKVPNPGDNVEYGGAGWNTFGPTDSDGMTSVVIKDDLETSTLKLREVFQDGYLPFTYGDTGNSNDVTAEFYCDRDVLNYDNWDWIRNAKYGETYNCVAWNVELGRLGAVKYEDINGNGQRDNGEPKLDGWVMTLKDENGDEVTTSITGDFKKGRVLFDNLTPGKYTICETLQDGWANSQPGTEDACRNVKVEYGKTKWRAFGNYQLGSITIVKDTGSTNAGWKDFGYTGDLDNFKLNGGDNPETNSQTFTGLTLGDYTVTENQSPTNWDLTSLECNSETIKVSLDAKTVTVLLTYSNEDVTCTFTNEKQGQVKITKYEDLNGNGEQDDGEQGLAGWQMFLYEPNDDDGWTQIQPRKVTTNDQGVANYTGLQPGIYLVCEEDVAGWANTQPGDSAIWKDGRICQEVEVSYGDKVPVSFGNRIFGKVKVIKFHDVNENGYYPEEGEELLEGWEMSLTPFISEEDTISQTTGEDGSTTFVDLDPRRPYLLTETPQDGWQQTDIFCEKGPIRVFGEKRLRKFIGDGTYGQQLEERDENTTYCYVGNTYQPVLEISKTNNKPEATVVGDTVTYTITVTVPEDSGCVYREGSAVMWPWPSGLSEQLVELPIFGFFPYARNCAIEDPMPNGFTTPIYINDDCEEECGEIAYGEVMVTDLPPEGFAYVPGSWTASSNMRDMTGITTEPTYASPGQWNLTSADSPFLVPGEVVILTYQAVIGNDVTNGDYPDTAFVEGYSRGSFDEEGSTKIYGNVTDAEPDTPFVGTKVTVLTTEVSEQGYVLGTSTLQVTGVPAILSPVIGALLALGAVLTITNRKKRHLFKNLAKGFGKSLASLGLALVISAFMFSSAFAAGFWTTNLSTPEAFTTNGVVNIDYQVTSTDPSDTFEVDLMQNGGVILTQSVSTNYGDSGRFPITLTTEGTYTFETSVLNNNGGETKNSNEVTVTFDKTAPSAPTYNGVTRSGDTYTVNFTAPTGDVSKVNVYASTATSFNLDASTKVGEVPVTPGETSQFVYTAPDSTQRYFAITAADAAGNQSGVVGDEIVTTTVASDATEGSTAGATTDDTGDEGVVSDEAAQTTADLEGAVDTNADEADDTSSIVAMSGIVLFVVLVGAAYFIISTNRRSQE